MNNLLKEFWFTRTSVSVVVFLLYVITKDYYEGLLRRMVNHEVCNSVLKIAQNHNIQLFMINYFL